MDKAGFSPNHGDPRMNVFHESRLTLRLALPLMIGQLSQMLLGDFNIAPLDTDVWDISEFIGATHVSPAERQAFEAFEQIGLTDVVRERLPEGYTYWDYQQLRFPKNEGMRIDFILGSESFAERVTSAVIDRNERKGEAPSDHVPVVVDLAD
ncbi:MAG: hypothetical protein RLZZ90_1067 [Actinomycetota bacterium]